MPHKKQLKDCHETFDVMELWFPFFENMNGDQILAMVGWHYWALVEKFDPREMTDQQIRFCRMVLKFEGAWKRRLYIEESWGDFACFLQECWATEFKPGEMKATRANWATKRPRKKCQKCDYEGPKRRFTDWHLVVVGEAARISFYQNGTSGEIENTKTKATQVHSNKLSIPLCRRCHKKVSRGVAQDELNEIFAKMAGGTLGKPVEGDGFWVDPIENLPKKTVKELLLDPTTVVIEQE